MLEVEKQAREYEEMKAKEARGINSGRKIVKIKSKEELKEQVKFMDVNQLKLNPTNLYIFQDYCENLNSAKGDLTET